MDKPKLPPSVHDRHLWQIRWVRDLVTIALILMVMYVGYAARAITVPVLIGLALAYAFNPLVTWLQLKRKIPRWLTTSLLMLLFVLVFCGLLAVLAPLLTAQFRDLGSKVGNVIQHPERTIDSLSKQFGNFLEQFNIKFPTSQPADAPEGDIPAPLEPYVPPSHAEQIEPATHPAVDGTNLAIPPTDAAQPPPAPQDDPLTFVAAPATQPHGIVSQVSGWGIDWKQVGTVLMGSVNIGLSVLGATLSLFAYIALAMVLIGFSFFMFSWKLGRMMPWITELIPINSRQRTLDVLAKMDRSVSAFIRGRLIQSAVLATVLSIGWGFVGVKYWLLLAIVAGVLNLIPYTAIIVWPASILLAWIGAGEFNFWWVLVWPSIIYFVAQLNDGWVVEPLVQGKATNLDLLAILMAVLMGGTLLGLFGMLLAIPTAACLKILLQEVILPRVREWARTPG